MSVYFARVKGYVKIGYSADPQRRAESITTGSCIKPDDVKYGNEVDLIGWVLDADRKREREIHRLLADHRVTGEWFWFVPEVETFPLDDPMWIDMYEASGELEHWMREGYPKTKVLAALQKARDQRAAERKAKYGADMPELGRLLGETDWVDDMVSRMHAMTEQKRAKWRERVPELRAAA